jgi:hypothetical protein
LKNRRAALLVVVLFVVMSAVGVCIDLATVAASLYYRPTVDERSSLA